MYGAYHHITVLGKESLAATETYDVTGSLCENNDNFAIGRKLPPAEIGDLVAIHDTGAHGHAMGFNYNGKLRSAELLLRGDGSVIEIRRAETMDDYFATLDFAALETFDGGRETTERSLARSWMSGDFVTRVRRNKCFENLSAGSCSPRSPGGAGPSRRSTRRPR